MPLTEQNMLTSSCCFHYQFGLIGLTLFFPHFFVLCWFNSVCSQPGLSCKPFMRGTCWCVESHRLLARPGWQVWNIPAPTLTFSNQGPQNSICACLSWGNTRPPSLCLLQRRRRVLPSHRFWHETDLSSDSCWKSLEKFGPLSHKREKKMMMPTSKGYWENWQPIWLRGFMFKLNQKDLDSNPNSRNSELSNLGQVT